MCRAIVISDCHGQPHLITNALDHANYKIGKDRLIFAGDIIHIGYEALECMDILLENRAELLWGNHELAIILQKPIHPQNPLGRATYLGISAIKDLFKVATIHDNVLITHAGLSKTFAIRYCDSFDDLDKQLNKLTLIALWDQDSPVWYRPTKNNAPIDGIIQVCGHSSPSLLNLFKRQYPNFYTVDPYAKNNFQPSHYRYAVIEYGEIIVEDSNY